MREPKRLTVNLGEMSYPIWIGAHLLLNLEQYLLDLDISKGQKLLIITDTNLVNLYGHSLNEQLMNNGFSSYLYTIPAGEPSKSIEQYQQIITFAIEKRLDRKSVILALGGGVVGDIAGFVASTYLRGITYIQLPTTIQAHDSSVGGKVAINHPLGKNLIGSFYQPTAVLYDTSTLTSLPQREVLSGFAEVLKEAFIYDEEFVKWLKQDEAPLQKYFRLNVNVR